MQASNSKQKGNIMQKNILRCKSEFVVEIEVKRLRI